jgi:hypothetical protein
LIGTIQSLEKERATNSGERVWSKSSFSKRPDRSFFLQGQFKSLPEADRPISRLLVCYGLKTDLDRYTDVLNCQAVVLDLDLWQKEGLPTLVKGSGARVPSPRDLTGAFFCNASLRLCQRLTGQLVGPSNLWHKEGLLTIASGKSSYSRVRLGKIRLGLAR